MLLKLFNDLVHVYFRFVILCLQTGKTLLCLPEQTFDSFFIFFIEIESFQLYNKIGKDAADLAKMGYSVTIFEALHHPGGVLVYGIPEFRLPKTILDRLKKALIATGVKIRPNTAIGANLTIDDLQRDGYKAIFIGTGVWRPNTMRLEGESLGNVHYAIDYLKNPDVYELGNEVVVIG